MRLTAVVFLDIDGVLHIRDTPAGKLDPSCVAALNWLTECTNARIVVSSTWRFMKNIRTVLKAGGVKARVVGLTPHTESTRGQEISMWLRAHQIERFVILDDDADMDDLGAHLVQSTFEKGLTLPLAELAARHLSDRC